MFLTIGRLILLVEHVSREGNNNTEKVKNNSSEKCPEARIAHRNAVSRIVAKFRETGFVEDTESSG